MAQTAESHAFAREEFEIPPEEAWDDLITEDDTPVDNLFSEKQQRLLTEALYASWQPGKPFAAMANVGLFFDKKKPPIVPDMLLSLNVKLPEDIWEKRNRSYHISEYGKPPEAAVEIVSNLEGDELDRKLETYAQIGIQYYVVHDPECQLSKTPLRVFKLADADYVETLERWLPKIGLGLTLWKGVYEERKDTWLRWCGRDRQLIPTGSEQTKVERQRVEAQRQRAETAEQRAETAKQQTEAERQRVEAQRQRAETAEQRAETAEQQTERLVAQLRALGIAPDEER